MRLRYFDQTFFDQFEYCQKRHHNFCDSGAGAEKGLELDELRGTQLPQDERHMLAY